MEEKKQKAGQIERKEILDAAKKVFLSKGFADTVVKDTITGASLSRGGVYCHCKNKVEILHDLMQEDTVYRIEKINEFLSFYSGGLDGSAVVQMIADKMLGRSEFMSVYAIYLQSTKDNEELRAPFPILVEESLKASYSEVRGAREDVYRYFRNDFLIFLINMIVLGCEILDGTRDSFVRNRGFFLNTVKLLIGGYDKGKIR